MINQWMFYLSAYLPGIHCHRLYLALALHQINEYIGSDEIEKQVKILLFSIDIEKLMYETDPDIINIQKSWYGVVLLLQKALDVFNTDYPNYENINSIRRKIVQTHLFRSEEQLIKLMQTDKKEIDLGFFGISGIGLLYLLYPKALEI